MSSPQWVDSSSTQVTETRQACWPQGVCWVARAPGLPAQRASTRVTRTQTPRSTGRSRTASTRWRGGWNLSSQTPWRAWPRRRRRRRPRGWSCFSTRLPGQCDLIPLSETMRLWQPNGAVLIHDYIIFCRDCNIHAVGVDSEGKLVPMSGLRESSLIEERESGSENDGEGEKNWSVCSSVYPADFLSPVPKVALSACLNKEI